MNRPSPSAHAPETPRDIVVCAIGDIHGRLDLLESATTELRRMAWAVAAQGKGLVAVFLGDYIDRGPDSSGVIGHLAALQKEDFAKFIFLRGNHEQVLLDLADGVDETLPWLDFGGLETLRSYGVEESAKALSAEAGGLGRRIVEAVPAPHLLFLRSTELYAKCGDYFFVHAGLRPDRLLDEQSTTDMLWFRYYTDEVPVHGQFVVHGHSTNERPILGRWRIGIDTEAYASGDLTILRLEDGGREFLRVSGRPGEPPSVSAWPSIASSFSGRETPMRRRAEAAAPAPRRGFRWPTIIAVTVLAAALAAALTGVAGQVLRRPEAQVPAAKAPPHLPVEVTRPLVAPGPSPPPQEPPALREPVEDPPRPSAAAPKPVQPAPGPAREPIGAGPRVQIGALDSSDLAETAWRELARRFPDLMASKALSVEPTNVQGRTLYRAYVAGFSTRENADAFCRKITSANAPCIVRGGDAARASRN